MIAVLCQRRACDDIPDDWIPVKVERFGCDEGADRDDEGDVEHSRPHHTANTHGVLSGNE